MPFKGFPGGTWWRIYLQCRRHKRCRFDPWVGKIPWRRKWQRTPILLSGKFHGQRSLVGYSPGGCKESDITEHITNRACFLKKNVCLFHKIAFLGNFLAVQWLGLSTSTSRTLGSIPGRGTKIPKALRHSKNKQTNKQKLSNTHIPINPFFSEKYSDIYTFSGGKVTPLLNKFFSAIVNV